MAIQKLIAVTVGSVVPKLLSVIALPLIMALVTPADYAKYAVIISLSTIILPVLVLGADNYMANISRGQLSAYIRHVLKHLHYSFAALLAFALIMGQSKAVLAIVIAQSMAAISIFSANIIKHSGMVRISVLIGLPVIALEISRLSTVFWGLGENPLILGHVSYAVAVLAVSLILAWRIPKAEYHLTKTYWSFAFARTSSQFLNNLSIQALPLFVYQTFDSSLSGILFASLTLLTIPYSVIGKKQVYLFNEEMKTKRSAHWIVLSSNILTYGAFIAALLLIPDQIIPAEWRGLKIFIVPLSIYCGTIFFLNPYLQLPAISRHHRNLFLFPIIRLSVMIVSIAIAQIANLDLNNFLWIYSVAVAVLAIVIAIRNVKTLDD